VPCTVLFIVCMILYCLLHAFPLSCSCPRESPAAQHPGPGLRHGVAREDPGSRDVNPPAPSPALSPSVLRCSQRLRYTSQDTSVNGAVPHPNVDILPYDALLLGLRFHALPVFLCVCSACVLTLCRCLLCFFFFFFLFSSLFPGRWASAGERIVEHMQFMTFLGADGFALYDGGG